LHPSVRITPFKKKEKRNALNHAIFFKFFVQQKHISLYENTYFLGEFDENPYHMKISKS
jgi:hypothetical protein